jgi:hydrogenase nickel incorporation protein HypA/HybF
MHEWALAEAVVATVEKIRRENAGRPLLSVNLRLGELQSVDPEAFRAGLAAALGGLPYGLEVFHFTSVPAAFRCRACGHFWPLAETYAYLRCPGCGSPDFALAAGRGVSIESVEFEGD